MGSVETAPRSGSQFPSTAGRPSTRPKKTRGTGKAERADANHHCNRDANFAWRAWGYGMHMVLMAAGFALFPGLTHHDVAVGTYTHEVRPTAFPATLRLPHGLTVSHRYTKIEEKSGGAGVSELRLYRDPAGITRLDSLETGLPTLATVRVRPEMGDDFDLAMLFGRSDRVWFADDLGWGQVSGFSPVELTLVGLSNTDMDEDRKVKHYLAAGLGAGGALIARIAGPLGLHLGGVGDARTLNRHRKDAKNSVRHEVAVRGWAGVVGLQAETALRLTGWFEHMTQWETRDADGRSGVDRQQVAVGIELGGRFYRDEGLQDEDDGSSPPWQVPPLDSPSDSPVPRPFPGDPPTAPIPPVEPPPSEPVEPAESDPLTEPTDAELDDPPLADPAESAEEPSRPSPRPDGPER